MTRPVWLSPSGGGSIPSPAANLQEQANTHNTLSSGPTKPQGCDRAIQEKPFMSQDMIEAKLNIEVSLSRETLDVLRQFAPDMPAEMCNCTAHHEDLKTVVEGYVVDFLERLQEHAKKPVDEAKPETAQSPVPDVKAPQAAPEPPATPEEKAMQEVTDAVLRQAVKEAKDRAGGTAVRTLFSEFEIPNSSACPQERRSELLGRLANL